MQPMEPPNIDRANPYNLDPHRLYTKKEVAAILSRAVGTISNWLHKGKLRRHKVGGGVRILGADLIAFIRVSE